MQLKCEFNGRKCNSNLNSNEYWCDSKNLKKYVCKKDYIKNPVKCSCKNDKYEGNIIDKLCDEILDTTKTVPSNSNEKR